MYLSLLNIVYQILFMLLYILYIGVAGQTCHIFFRLLTRFGSILVETMIRRTRCRVVTPSYYWWCSVWSYLPNSMLEIPSTAGYVCRNDNVFRLRSISLRVISFFSKDRQLLLRLQQSLEEHKRLFIRSNATLLASYVKL